MAQWFRTHTAPAEDLSLISCHQCPIASGDLIPLFWPPPAPALRCTDTHRHIIKNKSIYGPLNYLHFDGYYMHAPIQIQRVLC